MRFGLNGRRAVVTEATEQIGLTVVRALVEEGVHVIAGARAPSVELDDLVATGCVDVALVDLTDINWPTALVGCASGQLDILINNLGLATDCSDGSFEVTDDLWWRSLGLNLIAAHRATRAAIPLMAVTQRGAIVNVGCMQLGLPESSSTSPAAARKVLADLAESLSDDACWSGVRINSVSIDHPTMSSRHQLEKVADLVTFLCSDRAANIAGADFTVGGDASPIAEVGEPMGGDASSHLAEAANPRPA